MQDLTFTAEPEAGVDFTWNSIGTTIRVGPLENGLFKNVAIDSYRSQGFDIPSSVNLSFLNCVSSNSISGGDGGIGYAYHISSQNVLFKNCYSKAVSTGFTTAHPTACNVVFKNCRSLDYRNPVPGKINQHTDDTHLKFSHGILFDNHYSKEAGMFMINRGTLSTDAYETCGWSIVWNYQNEGWDTPIEGTTVSARHNFLCLTPAEFGMVIGAHQGNGPKGLSVRDGYTSYPASTAGTPVTTDPVNLKTGSLCDRTLYEYTGQPVAESLYDIQFAQREKFLSNLDGITFDSADYSSNPSNPAGGTSVTTPAGVGRALGGQGNLSGGSNGTWSSGSTWAVVAGAGSAGATGLVTSSTAGQYVSQTYTPTASELGNIPFNATSSKVDYSFDAKLVTANTTGAILRIYFGYVNSSNYAVALYINGDGKLRDGNSGTTLVSGLFNTTAFHAVSGQIDYAAGTYTVYVDGVPKAARTITGAPGGYGQIKLETRATGSSGTTALDNIGFAAVP